MSGDEELSVDRGVVVLGEDSTPVDLGELQRQPGAAIEHQHLVEDAVPGQRHPLVVLVVPEAGEHSRELRKLRELDLGHANLFVDDEAQRRGSPAAAHDRAGGRLVQRMSDRNLTSLPSPTWQGRSEGGSSLETSEMTRAQLPP